MMSKGQLRLLAAFLVAAFVLSLLGAAPVSVQAQGSKDRIKLNIKGGTKPLDVIKQLRAENLIPGGGKVDIQIPRSVISVRQPGTWYFPIGRGTRTRDYVMNFEMRAQSMDGETNACGMAFRIVNDDDFSFILLTKDRRIVLRQQDGGKSIVDFDESVDDLKGVDASDYELNREQLHIITIVANGQDLILFLNGTEIVREEKAKSVRGRFATMLFNEEGNETNTECRYSNIWTWDLSQ